MHNLPSVLPPVKPNVHVFISKIVWSSWLVSSLVCLCHEVKIAFPAFNHYSLLYLAYWDKWKTQHVRTPGAGPLVTGTYTSAFTSHLCPETHGRIHDQDLKLNVCPERIHCLRITHLFLTQQASLLETSTSQETLLANPTHFNSYGSSYPNSSSLNSASHILCHAFNIAPPSNFLSTLDTSLVLTLLHGILHLVLPYFWDWSPEFLGHEPRHNKYKVCQWESMKLSSIFLSVSKTTSEELH